MQSTIPERPNMYIVMKSERTSLRGGAVRYQQTAVAQYRFFDDAIHACDDANDISPDRYYLLNDAGKELYAGAWID